MQKPYQVIKPAHGFYKGECLDADMAPTIDTGVGRWHTLIGESMEEIKCEHIGNLVGDKWEKLHDQNRRVYSVDGLAPTIHTMGGRTTRVENHRPRSHEERLRYSHIRR